MYPNTISNIKGCFLSNNLLLISLDYSETNELEGIYCYTANFGEGEASFSLFKRIPTQLGGSPYRVIQRSYGENWLWYKNNNVNSLVLYACDKDYSQIIGFTYQGISYYRLDRF